MVFCCCLHAPNLSLGWHAAWSLFQKDGWCMSIKWNDVAMVTSTVLHISPDLAQMLLSEKERENIYSFMCNLLMKRSDSTAAPDASSTAGWEGWFWDHWASSMRGGHHIQHPGMMHWVETQGLRGKWRVSSSLWLMSLGYCGPLETSWPCSFFLSFK